MKRTQYKLSLVAGIVGTLGCLAVLVVVWLAVARIHAATNGLFATAERSLGAIDDRLQKAGERIEALRITGDELASGVRARAEDIARDTAAARLGMADRASQLGNGIEVVDGWLTTSESALQTTSEVLVLLESSGLKVESGGVEKLLADLGELRTELQAASDLVARAQRQLEGGDNEADERQGMRALVPRLIATLTSLDARVEGLRAGVQQLASKVGAAKSSVGGWMFSIAAVLSAILLWLAAGQVALAVIGWRGGNGPPRDTP